MPHPQPISPPRPLAAAIALLVLAPAVIAQTTLNLQVSGAYDDADQNSSGSVWVTDNYCGLGSGLYDGFRFQNVTIPQGATITNATLTLRGYGSATTSFTTYITAQDADTTSAFSTSSYNISNRPRTTAQVTWTMGNQSFTDGQVMTSPDISSVIQEVVDRSGWSSGSSMAMIFTPGSGAMSAYKYSGNASYAAKLDITYSVASNSKTILLVTANGTLTSEETSRKTQFESWGYTVTTIEDGASQASFDTAMASADVVYVPFGIDYSSLSYKLRDATIGVVSEAISNFDDKLGWTSTAGYSSANGTTTINVTNNTHSVTAGLSTGNVALYTSSTNSYFGFVPGTLSSGATSLGTKTSASDVALATLEVGATLANTYDSNSAASGRRVRLPFGNGSFSWSNINSTGLTLISQAIEWAASDALLLHWKMDDGSGTTVTDSSGNGRDGTATGTTGWTSGVRSGALDITPDSYVEVDGLLDEPNNFTVAAWVDVDAVDSIGGEIVSVGDYFMLRINTNGEPVILLRDSSAWPSMTHAGVNLIGAGWVHVAATFDEESDTLRIYVDGQLVKEQTDRTEVIAWGVLAYTKTRSGARYSGTVNHFDGRIDDLRIYNRAVTEAEIAEMYGLVGHWKLNESSGATAYDSSGVGNDGTYVGGVTPTADEPYPGADSTDFNGTSGYVSVPHDDVYNTTEAVTIAAWVRGDSPQTPGWAAVVTKGDSTWRLHRSGGGNILGATASLDGGGSVNVTGSGSITDGVWRHYVYTYDGTAGKLYQDGQLVGTNATAGTIATNTAALMIGNNASFTTRYWHGGIADVRVYNRAIQESEIAKLYGLVGHWALDETSGTTAEDSSLIGNDGTYVGGATAIVDEPYPGRDATEFDGATGYVDIPHHGVYDITDTVSMCVWVRGENTSSDWRSVLCKGDSAWRMQRRAENNMEGCANFTGESAAGPGAREHGTKSVTGGAWRHYVFTYDGTTARMFEDGQLVDSNVNPGTINTNSADLYIGNNPAFPTRYWEGGIADVRVYNRALRESEIAQLYGCIAHYKLDESSGSVAYDSSGMGHDAVLTGTATWTNGKDDGGFQHDYSDGNDYFTLPASTALNNATDNSYSISAWFKPLSVPPGTGSDNDAYYGVLNKAGYNMGLAYTHGQAFRAEAYLSDNSQQSADSSGTIATGVFYHVVSVVDPEAGTISNFFNGTLDSIDTFTPGATLKDYGTGVWRIGAANPGAGTYAWPAHGVTDDVRIYNRLLSAGEAEEIYEQGAGAGLRIIKWVEVR